MDKKNKNIIKFDIQTIFKISVLFNKINDPMSFMQWGHSKERGTLQRYSFSPFNIFLFAYIENKQSTESSFISSLDLYKSVFRE